MALDNATIQNPLPGNLQARVENALNLVTSLESEADRLRKFIANQKSEVNSIHAEQKYLSEQISSAKESVDTYKKQIQDANVALVEIHGKISSASKELEEAVSLKQQTLDIVTTKKSEYDAREADIQRRENIIAEDEREFLSQKAEHENRVERLKRAIE